MKFPRIFTETDKDRAIVLRQQHPELSEHDVIGMVVAEIHAEIARSENRPIAPELSAKAAAKKQTADKKPRSRRTYWRRLPGSFESAQR